MELIPAIGFVEGSQEEDGIGALFVPEDARAFETEVDDAADGALHRTAANGQPAAARPGVTEAVSVFAEIAGMFGEDF